MRTIGFVFCFIAPILLIAQDDPIIDQGDYNLANDYFENAKAAFEMENYAGAVNWFSKAIELNPNNADYFFGRAVSLNHRNIFNRAIADILMAQELEADQPDYHFQAGSIYFKAEKYEEAAREFGLSLKHQGNNDIFINTEKARYNQGVSFLMAKIYPDAIASFSELLAEDPQHAEAYYNRGVAHLKLGSKTDACPDFQKALEMGFHKANSHLESSCK